MAHLRLARPHTVTESIKAAKKSSDDDSEAKTHFSESPFAKIGSPSKGASPSLGSLIVGFILFRIGSIISFIYI